MQNLLEEFNKIDHRKQGSIRLSEAVKLVQATCKSGVISEELVSKVILNVERQVSFD